VVVLVSLQKIQINDELIRNDITLSFNYFKNMLNKVDVIVFFEQPADGSEMWVLGSAHQLKQKRLGGGKGHIGGAFQPLKCHLTVICPIGRKYTTT